ncbi:adenosylmethionine decarboxylase [Shewanella sp. OPT22]|nr:adenosylmethionine decarboxylase [Shewanella sp. OPT22]
MFITSETFTYAGNHLLLDVWGAKFLDNHDQLLSILTKAVLESNATVLGNNFHSFPDNGVTGVITLAESHISIHTWPKADLATIDIFMCGNSSPNLAVDYILKHLQPSRSELVTVKRALTEVRNEDA